ncbi:MAG: T9SS type A sorting domain-containing protein [Bacteroidota bacterium]|nr:T9SS type A sorting domain-containing protein [Bacteroidota bacterium]
MYNYRHQAEVFHFANINALNSSYLIGTSMGVPNPQSDSAYWTNGFGFIKTNYKGDIDSNSLYIYYKPHCRNSVVEVLNYDKDTGVMYWQFSYSSTNSSGLNIFENYIVCFSNTGDSLCSIRLLTQNDSNTIYSVIKYNNSFFNFGWSTAYQGSQVFLAKYDLSGQSIFHKPYNGIYTPAKMNLISNNRILMVGGHHYYNWDGVGDNKPWYMITDTNGYKLFEKKYFDSIRYDKYMTGIHKINANCFLIDGSKNSYIGDNTFFYLMDTLGKINRQWSLPIEYGIYNASILEGKYIVAAANDKKDSIDIGKLIKTDTTGNIIWQREYYTSYYTSIFYGLSKGFNNGFIITGTAIDTTHATAHQDAWLVVTDSFGCVTPGCHLANYVQEISVQKIEYLSSWPNPVHDLLKCKLHPSLLPEECLLVLIDINGKELLKIKPTENNIEIPVSKLPDGFYYLMLLKNNKLLGSSKLIKE